MTRDKSRLTARIVTVSATIAQLVKTIPDQRLKMQLIDLATAAEQYAEELQAMIELSQAETSSARRLTVA